MEKMKRPRKDDSKPRRPKKQMTESKSKPVRRPAMNKRPQKPPAPKVKERIPKKPSKNGIAHRFLIRFYFDFTNEPSFIYVLIYIYIIYF